jgi:hypothetical protein
MLAAGGFSYYLAAATGQGTSSDGTVLAAAIAAGASFVAALVAAVSSVYTARKQSDSQKMQYARLQLQELYGPLMMLRAQSTALRAKIGPPGQNLTDPGDWRLVEHIEDIKADSAEAGRVESINSINDDITKLLKEKGGLSLQLPQPASFAKFLEHAEYLAKSWKAHKNQQGDDRAVFPRDFDDDINAALKKLRKTLGEK